MNPFAWVVLSVGILVGDYYSGPVIQFPVLYLIPVSLSAWYNGILWGLTFAIVLPLMRLAFLTAVWTVPWHVGESIVNTGIRILVLGAFACLVHRTAMQTRQMAQRVRILEGILPICSFCKKIRDPQGIWHPIEAFIADRSDAHFSHGFCPECGQQHYGQYLKKGESSSHNPL